VTIIVGIYFLALLSWGAYNFYKSLKSPEDDIEIQYVGERNFGTIPLLATLVAAWASNYTLIAAAESGFNFGISGPIWYSLGVAVPLILFVWPINIAKKIRETMPDGVTMVEFIGIRFDEKTRIVTLIVVLLSNVVYIISIILAVGI